MQGWGRSGQVPFQESKGKRAWQDHFRPEKKDARHIFLILVDSFGHTTGVESNLLLQACH